MRAGGKGLETDQNSSSQPLSTMPDGRRTNYTECDTDAITEWRIKERLVLVGPAKGGKINNRNAAREKAETMTLTVYTKPACVQCNAVFRTLDRLGTKYRRVDIS